MDFANWAPIEVMWTAFATGGLGVALYNLRRSRAELAVSEPSSDERVYAIGAIVRDWGRVIAQSFGVAFGLYAGFFGTTQPSVFGSTVFMVYIGLYTIGSVSDAVVRWAITREK